MSKIDELIQEYCPDGVSYESLGGLCKIETGKLNANAAVENGQYLFFTTAKEISRIDKYRWDTEALLIAGNANVGDVKHYEGKFDAYQRTYVLNTFDQSISVRFLYFFISSALKNYLENRTNSAAMTYIVLSTLQDFKVPVPPLEVQKEIVNILDKFTQLEAELSAELDARRKQYKYYRNQLLSFSESEVPFSELGDVYEFQYGTGNTIPTTGGIFPVYGSNGIVGSHHEFNSEESPVIGHIGAYAGIVNWAAGKHFVTYNGVICRIKNGIDTRFGYHLLKRQNLRELAKDGSQPFVSYDKLKSVRVQVPNINKQREISVLLDNFDKLVNDISEGLPAEIAARHEQYEYYRTKLLTFKEQMA